MFTTKDAPLIADNGKAIRGLEQLAERGDPSLLIGDNPSGLVTHLDADPGVLYGGAFTKVGVAGPATTTIGPVEAYEFTFKADYGVRRKDAPNDDGFDPDDYDLTRLTFAAMYVPSSDLFYAPSEMGIELFDKDYAVPLKGDITDKVMLWDAGTEANDTGEDEDGVVHTVNEADYPPIESIIKVTINERQAEPGQLLNL